MSQRMRLTFELTRAEGLSCNTKQKRHRGVEGSDFVSWFGYRDHRTAAYNKGAKFIKRPDANVLRRLSLVYSYLLRIGRFLAVSGGMGSGWESSVRSAMSIVTDASFDQPSSVRSGIEVRTPILQLRITSIASDALLDMPLLTELG